MTNLIFFVLSLDTMTVPIGSYCYCGVLKFTHIGPGPISFKVISALVDTTFNGIDSDTILSLHVIALTH